MPGPRSSMTRPTRRASTRRSRTGSRLAINRLIRDIVNGAAEGGVRRLHGDAVRQRPDRSAGLRGSLSARLHRRPAAARRCTSVPRRSSAANRSSSTPRTSRTTATTSCGACPIEEIDGLRPKGTRQATRVRARDHRQPGRRAPVLPAQHRCSARPRQGQSTRHRARSTRRSTSTSTSGPPRRSSAHLRVARRLAWRDATGPARVARERCGTTSASGCPREDFGLEPVAWDDVAAMLPAVAEDAEVITDNSQSMERLDFDDDEPAGDRRGRRQHAVARTDARGARRLVLRPNRLGLRHPAADGPVVRLPQRLRRPDPDLDDRRDARVVPPSRDRRAGDPLRHRALRDAPRHAGAARRAASAPIRSSRSPPQRRCSRRGERTPRTPVGGSRRSSSITAIAAGSRATSRPARALVAAPTDRRVREVARRGSRSSVRSEQPAIIEFLGAYSVPREQPRPRLPS